jgi:N6-adenosine-specific RNA methylase IME4
MTTTTTQPKTPEPTGGSSGPYRVIYADPPWDIGQTGARGASRHYDLLNLDNIKGMGEAVQVLAAPDSVLLLWVTNNALPAGLAVMEAWGFRYVSNAAWDKYYMGLGNYVRNSHELLLLGIRGKVTPKFRGQRSVLHFPRMEHSVKPAEMYPMIERLFDGPYLELFARSRPNSQSKWSIWGNECDSDVSLAPWGYAVPSDFARQDSAADAAKEDGDAS